MIEQVMYFALGMLVAGLAIIALLPALWRRAVRLTRARLEATLPLTPDEIAAEKDRIRASHAVDFRRVEIERDTANGALQAAKADIGAKLTVLQAQEATIASQAESIGALRKDGDDLRVHIAGLDARIATLETERDNLATNLSASRISNQALDQQAMNLRQAADQSLARQSELEAQTEALNTRLIESLNVTTQLRDDVQAKGDELRLAARKLREAASHIAQSDRRLAATETLAADRQQTIDDLQAERLQLIEEAGLRARERDHERIERQALAAQLEQTMLRLSESTGQTETQIGEMRRTIDQLGIEKLELLDERARLTRERDAERAERQAFATQIAALKAQADQQSQSAQATTINHLKAAEDLRLDRARLQDELARLTRQADTENTRLTVEIDAQSQLLTETRASLAASQELVRDLTRTVEQLRRETRRVEEELSSARLERLAGEQELTRLRRAMQGPENAEAAPPPPRPAAVQHPGETQL